MIGLAKTGLALVVIWALGALLLTALGLRQRRWPLRSAQPALDFAAGTAVLATLWTVTSLVGTTMPRALVWGVLAALGLAALLRHLRARTVEGEERLPWPAPLARWGGIAVLLLAVIVTAAMVINTYRTPMFWDGRYIWAFKAKSLFLDQRLDRDTFTSLPRYRYAHNDYPIGYSAAETWVDQVVGSLEERKEKFIGTCYWLGTVVLLACHLRRRVNWGLALGLATVAGAVPVAAYYGSAAGADIPQGFYFLAGGVLLAEWLEAGRREDGLLSALMFGMGALIKAEGASMALGGALALAVAFWVRREQVTAKYAAWSALALGLPFLPWMLLRSLWHIPSPQVTGMYLRTAAETWSRFALVAHGTLARFWDWGEWELCWPFAAFGFLAYLLTRRRTREPAFLWALVIWQWWVFAVVYVLSPYNVAEHLSTSLNRLLLQLIPLALAAAGASVWEREEEQIAASAQVAAR